MFLVHTSLMFLSVALRAYHVRRRATHHVFMGLACTSVIFHSANYSNSHGVVNHMYKYPTLLFNGVKAADAAMVGVTIAHNVLSFRGKMSFCKRSIILTQGVVTFYLFVVGRIHKRYCFDKRHGDLWHGLIHVIVTASAHLTLL